MCQPAAWFWQKLKLSQSVVNLDYNFAINPSRGHPNERCVSMALWQWPQGSISDLVRSSTIKSGAAPDSTILSRVCEVQTASVRAPAARPAINPDGASSTTRPAASRACSAACHRFVLPFPTTRDVQFFGSTPTRSAPARYGSGWGLPRLTSLEVT
jgi:hypothetical protein